MKIFAASLPRKVIYSFCFACLLLQIVGLSAYPYDDTLNVLPQNGSSDGTYTRTDGTVEDYRIPIVDWPSVIDFSIIRGGDGGRAKAIATAGEDLEGKGGGGALLSAQFEVDPYADDALRPGGKIRFVIGSRGQNKTRNHSAGSGGGGGTAILYLAPVEGAEWEMLAVAGGGGGAAASTIFNDTFSHDGLNANTDGDGDRGRVQGGSFLAGQPGGKDGTGGQTPNDGSSGGGGGYNQHSADQYGNRWDSSGDAGATHGGAGGIGNQFGSWGGFGFGGGGGGFVNNNDSVSPTVAKGGGGGGYSGGGAGGNHNDGDGAGGGAGSYISNRATQKTALARNSGNLDGNITFSASSPSPTGSLPGPIFSRIDSQETIWDYEVASYSHRVTVADVYGNALELIGDSWNPSNGLGTYVLNFSATDQFGKFASTTKTVTVLRASKPTFEIDNYIGILEDSGEYRKSFVRNARTNDPSQIVINYRVDNDNPDLFTSDGQPDITQSGLLSFTPADNANGTANVTVVAVDNAQDLVNGSSDPQSFEIRVVGIDDRPTLTRQTGLVFNENTDVAIHFTAAEPFGAPIVYTLSSIDAPQFSFDAETLTLRLNGVPNFEAPTNYNQDNRYQVTLTATGSDGETSETMLVRILDLEEAPTIPTLSNLSILENTTAIGTISSTDPDGGAITYGLIGVDAHLFDLNTTTGELNFLNAPDYENPLDANGDRGYEIKLTATDTSQVTTSNDITISVLNESVDLSTPTLTATTLVEGNTLIGELFSEGESGEIVSFELVGGADQSLFEIVGNSLTFKTAPDFGNPTDQNGDNVYEVQINSSIYDLVSPTATYSITVVSENNQPPSTPELSNESIFENESVVGELSSADPNGDLVQISITGGADAELFEVINGNTLAFIEAPDFDSPADADGDNQYEVHVSASDAVSTSEESVFLITVENLTDNPAIDILLNGESVDEIFLEENLSAGTLVGTITAIDLDPGDSNTFELTTSSSRRFELINGDQLIVTGDPQLDYEADNFHIIRIEATDTAGLTYTKLFGIRVIDVDETSILKRENYTLDTDSNKIWLAPHVHDGRKVNVVEGRVERGDIIDDPEEDGYGYNWQFATWDEYIQYLKNASYYWSFNIYDGYWVFWFEDDYFDQDGSNGAVEFETFDMLGLNRDGSYGRNLAQWWYDHDLRPRGLRIYPQSDSSLAFRELLYDNGVLHVTPFSPKSEQELLHLEGEPNTDNRIDVYLIVDRSSGVGFENWATGQERSTYFDGDDDGDGRAVGIEYVFGAEKPMQMLATNQIQAPPNLWSDVNIYLEVNDNLSGNWTTILSYEGGVIKEDENLDPSITIEDGIITYGDADHNTQLFYRYRVEQFDPSSLLQ